MSSENRSWVFAPLVVGIMLAFVSSAVALGFTLSEDVKLFPEIVFACARNGLDGIGCQTGAIHAGWVNVLVHGFSLLFLGFLFWRFRAQPSAQSYHEASEPKRALVAAFLLIPIIHLFLTATTLATGSRIDEIQRFSVFISLENAFWPLWVLFYAHEKPGLNKALMLIALLMVLMLTPYRAVGMAIILFGFFLPMALRFICAARDKTIKSARSSLMKEGALFLLITVFVATNGYQDSKSREIPMLFAKTVENKYADDLPLRKDGTIKPSQKPRLHQRLSYPLYQAGMVEHLAKTQPDDLPGIADELLRKLHLSDKPTLNEYVYQRIYLGEGVGQTTSMTYGEAAAYFPKMPYLWMMGVPFGLIGLWFVLRRRGVETSTLMGLALWRSSQAGFVTIIPSLTLQLGLYGGLLAYGKIFARESLIAKGVKRFSYIAAFAALVAIVCVGSLSIVDTLTTKGSRVAILSTNNDCVFDMATTPDGLRAHVKDRFDYHLRMKTPNFLTTTVPAGQEGAAHIKTIIEGLNTLAHCPDASSEPTMLLSERVITPQINPILLFVLGFIAYVLARYFRLPLRQTKVA